MAKSEEDCFSPASGVLELREAEHLAFEPVHGKNG
jgi:hypothetical protein